jgi:hypothetical protein
VAGPLFRPQHPRPPRCPELRWDTSSGQGRLAVSIELLLRASWFLVPGLVLLGAVALAAILVRRARRAASRMTPEDEERVRRRLRDLP